MKKKLFLLLVILYPVENLFLLTTAQGIEQFFSQRVYLSTRQSKQRFWEWDATAKNWDWVTVAVSMLIQFFIFLKGETPENTVSEDGVPRLWKRILTAL